MTRFEQLPPISSQIGGILILLSLCFITPSNNDTFAFLKETCTESVLTSVAWFSPKKSETTSVRFLISLVLCLFKSISFKYKINVSLKIILN